MFLLRVIAKNYTSGKGALAIKALDAYAPKAQTSITTTYATRAARLLTSFAFFAKLTITRGDGGIGRRASLRC